MHATDPSKCGEKYQNFYTYINGLRSDYFDPLSAFMLLSRYYEVEFTNGFGDLIKEAEIKVTIKDIKQFLAEQAKSNTSSQSINLSSCFPGKNDKVSATQAHPSKLLSSVLASSPKSSLRIVAEAIAYYKHNASYIKNTKARAHRLLKIIINIIIGNVGNIEDELKELDIQLNESGKISNADLKRLLLPLVWNIDALLEKVAEANNLENYVGRSNDIPISSPADTQELQGATPEESNSLFFVPWSQNQLEKYQKAASLENAGGNLVLSRPVEQQMHLIK